MLEKNKKRQIAKISVFITSIFVILFSITYAFVTKTVIGNKKVVINAGVIDLVLEEENEITISDALPMYDQVGMIQEESFDFKLINKGEMSANYELKLVDISTGNSLSKNIVRYGLTKNGNTTIDYLSTPYMGIVDSGIIEKGETYNYELRLWISDKVVDESKITNKSLSLKIEVKSGQLDETKYIGMIQARKATDAFWKYNESITSVVFENEISVPEEGIEESWDVSTAKDGSVMAYIEDDGLGTDTYKLHIQGNDVIYANKDSSNLFNGFNNTTSIEGLEYFDTSNATNMREMFRNCFVITTLDVSNFNTSNVTNMYGMFANCYAITTLYLSNFDTSNVTNMHWVFGGCNSLTDIDLSNFNTSNVTDMSNMFEGCNKLTTLYLSNFDTSNVTNMQSLFNGCSNLTTLDISNFNTSSVTNMSTMFYGCRNLTTLDISNFNTSSVTNMGSMFGYCKVSALDLTNFDTSNVTNMSGMFIYSSCRSIDVSNFNTTKVTNMSGMFFASGSLTTLDLGNFDTSNVTDMNFMFRNCGSLTTLDLSNFDTSNVTNMSDMFFGCGKLTTLDLGNFDTSNVTNMHSLFNGCSKLTTDITVKGNTTSYTEMFTESATSSNALITVNYTADTSLLVDEMLKTKSTNSNVVKGKEVE